MSSNSEPKQYVARYAFAGATGRSKCCDSLSEAVAEGDKIYEHYMGFAQVWLDTQPSTLRSDFMEDPTRIKPTVSGYYWFRKDHTDEWEIVDVSVGSRGRFYERIGSDMSYPDEDRDDGDHWGPGNFWDGQWIGPIGVPK